SCPSAPRCRWSTPMWPRRSTWRSRPTSCRTARLRTPARRRSPTSRRASREGHRMATGGATDTLGRPLAPDPDVPRLATDVELIGRFEDSGFKEPPYIVRRRDGQVVQLAPVLYALAEEVDGRRDTARIAEALSHRIQRGVDAAMVEMLLEGQLRRLGIVAQRNGITAEVQKVDPLL